MQINNSPLHNTNVCKRYFCHTLSKDGDNVGGKCGYSSKASCWLSYCLVRNWVQNLFFTQKCCWAHLLMACSSSVMPVSLNARLDSSRLRAIALCRSSLSSPVRSITSALRKYTHKDAQMNAHKDREIKSWSFQILFHIFPHFLLGLTVTYIWCFVLLYLHNTLEWHM